MPRAIAPALAAFVLYLSLGWVRYQSGSAGNFDLGLFSQVARSWAETGLPASEIKGPGTIFKDHFSPITVLYAPGWLLWSDPRSLIVTQAAFMAVAVAILSPVLHRLLPTWQWALTTACMIVHPGLVAAARFDVHEVTLGLPFMAAALRGLLDRSATWLVVGSAGLVLTKEDLGLTVIALGISWAILHRSTKLPAAVTALGAAGLATAFAVIGLANDTGSAYLRYFTLQDHSAVSGGWARLAPLGLFLLSCGIIGVRSPAALVALPTLLWRMVSNNPNYWSVHFHYDALLAPIAAAALGHALASRPSGGSDRTPRDLLAAASLVLTMCWGMAEAHPNRLAAPASWNRSPVMASLARQADRIPEGSVVVADQSVGTPLVPRYRVRMLQTVPRDGDWVVLRTDIDSMAAPRTSKLAWIRSVQDIPGVAVWSDGPITAVRLPTRRSVSLPPPPQPVP